MKKNEMRGIGVICQDEYAVEEAFQVLKIPWEWYDPSEEYDVVIGRKEDLNSKDANFNLIDLSEDDISKKLVICSIMGYRITGNLYVKFIWMN